MFNMRVVDPKRLDPGSKLKFRCHKGIGCFTKCCGDIDILLTPYDVLRMKKRLGISSGEFLESYTVMRTDKQSSHPYAYLKMGEDAERRCPFVSHPEGCSIYADRPVSCRYYPVGQATMKKRVGEELVHEEFYFLVKEKHCEGFDEDKVWTIQSWNDDQEAAHYDEMNRGWKELLMRRNLPGGAELDEKKKTQFFMASYDLDRFRRFVFDSRFLDVFDIDPAEVQAMREDETALMKFAFKYIKYILMMQETLKLKDGVLDKGVTDPTKGVNDPAI